jgi:hypothetical protein
MYRKQHDWGLYFMAAATVLLTALLIGTIVWAVQQDKKDAVAIEKCKASCIPNSLAYRDRCNGKCVCDLTKVVK